MKKQTPEDIKANQLVQKERLMAAAKALCCLVTAVVVLLYGLSLATNLNTLLNPVNTTLNILIAVLCYGTVAVLFIFLWHHFSRYMTQAISGLKK